MTAGAIGAIAPYLAYGKIAGAGLRSLGHHYGFSGLSARLAASETSAMVLGAALYDGMRETRPRETRLGNVLGGVTGFAVFGIGNRFASVDSTSYRLIARAAVGVIGGEAQYAVSSAVSGTQIKSSGLRDAGLHGATINVILPALSASLSRYGSSASLRAGRGTYADRFAEHLSQPKSSTLNALVSEHPLAIVHKTENVAHAAEVHVQKQQILIREANLIGDFAHELGHLQIARTYEPQYQTLASEVQAGRVEPAKEQFLRMRNEMEVQARQLEHKVKTELGVTSLSSRAEGGHALPESYREKFQREWHEFVNSKGEFRPATEQSTRAVEELKRLQSPPFEPFKCNLDGSWAFEQSGKTVIKLHNGDYLVDIKLPVAPSPLHNVKSLVTCRVIQHKDGSFSVSYADPVVSGQIVTVKMAPDSPSSWTAVKDGKTIVKESVGPWEVRRHRCSPSEIANRDSQ